MLKYDHLLGREFVYGRADCYTLMQDFFRDNFGIHLTNYARPNQFWEHGLDLYRENFFSEGFRVVDEHPTFWKPCDVILMAIHSKVANHAAVIVESNRILHHMIGHRSKIDPFLGLYRNNALMVLRHKDVDYQPAATKVELLEIVPDAVRQRFAALETGWSPGESGFHSPER